MNSPRYVANLFHARSGLPRINPLAITGRARGRNDTNRFVRDMVRVTCHFAGKTDGTRGQPRVLFKRIAPLDNASNIFNALSNNPPLCNATFACRYLLPFNRSPYLACDVSSQKFKMILFTRTRFSMS